MPTPATPPAPRRLMAAGVLLLAVCCLGTSIIFLRLSKLPPAHVAGLRLVVASLLLAPMFWRDLRAARAAGAWRWQSLRFCLTPALLLAVHFILWVQGARLAVAANASLIVNMVPCAMPVALFFVARERVNARELIGTALALGGVALLAASDAHLAPEHLRGDAICFAAMLLLAIYYAFGRKNGPRFSGVWLYVAPLYLIAGLSCLAAAPALGEPLDSVAAPGIAPRREAMIILALAVLPTIFGHGLINWCLRHLRGQVVAVCGSAQFPFAGFLAFLVFGELPPAMLLPASALVLSGAAIAVYARGPADADRNRKS
ncbi:MAG: DMT family transporter [Verrucomicrobiales bacterium]